MSKFFKRSQEPRPPEVVERELAMALQEAGHHQYNLDTIPNRIRELNRTAKTLFEELPKSQEYWKEKREQEHPKKAAAEAEAFQESSDVAGPEQIRSSPPSFAK